MSKLLQPTEMTQHENKLITKWKSSLTFSTDEKVAHESEVSSEITCWGLIKFQIKNNLQSQKSSKGRLMIYDYHYETMFIKLSKVFQSDRFNYKVTLISNLLKMTKSFFILDDNLEDANWQIYLENPDDNSTLNDFFDITREFDLTLSFEIISCYKVFNSLLEDTNLTDLELRGVDGSVRVHKAVLAGYSPVMMTMFSGDWKEVATGVVQVTNTTKETLQQLKDFLYIRKLPESGITDLAVLASTYMISELQEYCTAKLLMTLTADNTSELLSIALKYNMEKLKLGILGSIQSNGVISIKDIIKKTDAAATTDIK